MQLTHLEHFTYVMVLRSLLHHRYSSVVFPRRYSSSTNAVPSATTLSSASPSTSSSSTATNVVYRHSAYTVPLMDNMFVPIEKEAPREATSAGHQVSP